MVVTVTGRTLSEFLAAGGSWTRWRHEHTDYNAVTDGLVGPVYREVAGAFADEAYASTDNAEAKGQIARWAKAHARRKVQAR